MSIDSLRSKAARRRPTAKRLLIVAIALWTLTNATPQTPESKPKAGDIRLKLSLQLTAAGTTETSPNVVVTIENVGTVDAIVNLGSMLGNGVALLPESIQLIVTGPDGKLRVFEFSDPRYPGVAGRVDPYLVPIRAGSAYTIALTPQNFWCRETKEFELKLGQGENTIRARVESKWPIAPVNLGSDVSLQRVWAGRIESEPVTFRVVQPPA